VPSMPRLITARVPGARTVATPCAAGAAEHSVDSKMYTRWTRTPLPTSRPSCAPRVVGCCEAITATGGTRKTDTSSCKIQERHGDHSRTALATLGVGSISLATGIGSSGNCRSLRAMLYALSVSCETMSASRLMDSPALWHQLY
jgi:hypothetical protein